ncbi:MAG: DUF6502 family protein [Pseudomonadaceae bacterium]|nr:DUF6502 family protein [Pseudomonadaceae bacterium]
MIAEQHLLRAARRILLPLVRIMLRNGIASDAFTELVRKAYVDVADDEFGIPGKKQTVSRISVITGLNRKEVARLRGMDPVDGGDERWRNRAATVLGAWELDPAFLDRKGDPLELKFAGASPSFSDLVKKHSGDMQPRAVLDELIRVGSVESVEGERFRMSRRGYEPSGDPEAMIDILGVDAAEFIETIDFNVQNNPDESLMQGKVLYNNVPVEHERAFLDFSRRQGRKLIDELNHWLSERDLPKDSPESQPRRTLGVGIFQINKPSPFGPEATGDRKAEEAE